MRRLLSCLLWFVLFAFVALMASGLVVVLGCPETEEFSVGYECGKTTMEQFMDRYRLPIIAVALLLSVAGTLAGVLPGTRKR